MKNQEKVVPTGTAFFFSMGIRGDGIRRGERWERRRGRIQRPERVAAVGEGRSRTDGKESAGHRNRMGAKNILAQNHFAYFGLPDSIANRRGLWYHIII